MSLAPQPTLADRIRAAREALASGAGPLLEVLLRGESDDSDLPQRLEAEAGVVVVLDSDKAIPDFARWDRRLARMERSILLRDARGRCLAVLPDPWDDKLLARMAQAAGEQPMAALVSQELLADWLRDDGAPGQDRSATQLGGASGPVVGFVDDALRAGFKGGASDVHFETDRHGVTAKFRLDGVMVRHSRLDGHREAEEAISRIKVLAALDITERRLPQDGRMRLDLGNGPVDLRVSIMPSVHGEDAVLRLLDKSQLRGQQHAAVTLDSLAFDEGSARVIRELANLPSGMLLVTGPTGSGKTTTVYAALSEINTGLEKIITIEDPVEYELTGVLQIPVNERKGLTFAKGLRSILRHDPDRILVGEIRDAETAEIAVQSALTGHQVFTTVHANSMADIIGRFRHFDIDMFGFMSALNGVVVQRLLRRLCQACVQWQPPTPDELRWIGGSAGGSVERIPHAAGCAVCRGTGYKGRFVVCEVHDVDDELRDLVTEQAPMSALKAHAHKRGVVLLLERAIGHVLVGRTSTAEVRRVIGARGGT